MAQRLNTEDRRRINGWLRQVAFYGTPEKCYQDSGFWIFAQHVMTKDEHDYENPVKTLDIAKYQYLQVIWLHMLHLGAMLVPKSRQIRMSWAAVIFAAWFVRTAPHRLVVFQSLKEDDAQKMVSCGKDDPVGGRISLIEMELPWWLKDYHVVSGKGNRVGELVYYPKQHTDQGVKIPWYGSRIIAIPQGAHQIRGKVPSLYLADEVGLWDEFKATWGAAAPAIDSGVGIGRSKMFAFSSVYAGGEFNETVLEGVDITEGGNCQIDYTGIPEMQPIVDNLVGKKLPRGMRSFVTPSGMPVLECHYAADPEKRPETAEGQAWMAKAAKKYIGGVNSPDWQREMEINYHASGGSLVFPEAADPRSKIWHRPLTFRDVRDMGLKLYAGYDFGARSPSAWILWGQSPEGKWYAIDEIYEPCINYVDHCQKIKTNRYMVSNLVNQTVCDPQMCAENQMRPSGKASMLELFREQGVHMTPGRKGADMMLVQLIRHWWRDPENPELFICENCWNLKREIQGLKWHIYTGAVARTKNLPEKIMDKNNHGFDASAYLHDTRPKPPAVMEARRHGKTWDDHDQDNRRREQEALYAAYRI